MKKKSTFNFKHRSTGALIVESLTAIDNEYPEWPVNERLISRAQAKLKRITQDALKKAMNKVPGR
jgi:hypothetical protein